MFAYLFVFVSLWAVPSVAEAKLEIATSRAKKERPEPKPRKGIYVGGSLTVGSSLVTRGFVPSVGYRMEFGGGLSDRITLGAEGGLEGHQGIAPGLAGRVNVVLTGFVRRGLFIRVGPGVTSIAVARAERMRPGLGGLGGLGYEFRPLKRMALAVGVDYEANIRTDGRFAQAFVLSLRMRGYFSPKK